MPLAETLLIVLVVAVVVVLALQVALLLRGNGGARLEQALREEQRAGRAELAQSVEQFRASLETLRGGLAEDARKAREENRQVLQQFGDQLQLRLVQLTGDNEKRMGEMRTTLETRLKAIQDDNTQKLEQMRATVDEKLQATLETRLGQSFELVSKRLEEVQRGLGEMKELATGVGDLKRVLSNVKTRGIFGEVQLGALLEQLLTRDQYDANVATAPGSAERVEFAIRLPGAHADQPVWLPIDAKFPREDYERLLDAREHADVDAANAAALALERRVRDEARRICDKYIAPPHTTDFALLFLPTEGLYAEVISRPGLFEALQQSCRVTIAGPSTLSALLNSLRMGFRTLAIEQRSSEVWQVLAAVKSEFGKFSGILERAEKQINTVGKSLGDAGRKTRTIERRLRGVETLSVPDAKLLIDEILPAPDGDEDDDTADAAG
jgi:DNA recombination protein RmuC